MGQAGVGANAELTQWPMPQLTYPIGKNPALVMVYKVGAWVSEISVTGSILLWR